MAREFPEIQCTGYFIRVLDLATREHRIVGDINSDSPLPFPMPGDHIAFEGSGGTWAVRRRVFTFLPRKAGSVWLYCDLVSNEELDRLADAEEAQRIRSRP